jgi:hypothetical protein
MTTPNAEFLSAYITEAIQGPLRSGRLFSFNVPGVSIKAKARTIPIQDGSSFFKNPRSRGKSQQLVQLGAYTPETRIFGTDPAYQNRTRTYRTISINTPIHVADRFMMNDMDFYQIKELIDQGTLAQEFADAIHDKMETDLLAVTPTITIGSGAADVVGLGDYSEWRRNINTTTKGGKGHVILTEDQETYLSGYQNLNAPYNALGQQGVQNLNDGVLMQDYQNISTYSSARLTSDGSTGAYGLLLAPDSSKGKAGDALGVAIGYMGGFKWIEDKEQECYKCLLSIEYGVYINDTRRVFRLHYKSNPITA